jgi:hypothetical protein
MKADGQRAGRNREIAAAAGTQRIAAWHGACKPLLLPHHSSTNRAA